MRPALNLLEDNTLVISPSQLDEIKRCPRAWLYRYIYRRVKVGAFGARDGGKAFDAAMNLRYTKLGNQPVLPGSELEQEMFTAIDSGFAGLDLPLEEYRNAALYRQVLEGYNKQWQRESFNVLAVQLPFAVDLGFVESVRVVLHGILDMLVEQDGRVFVFDTKTASSFNDQTMIQWENASQPKAYAYGLQELARKHPELGFPEKVAGFWLNCVILRPPYKNESRKPTAKDLPRIEFRRPIFLYTQEQLEEWRTDTLAWIGMALGWVANDHFPQNEKSCANHYGKACPYLGVCTFPAKQREMILASDEYRDYEKSPMFAAPPAVV